MRDPDTQLLLVQAGADARHQAGGWPADAVVARQPAILDHAVRVFRARPGPGCPVGDFEDAAAAGKPQLRDFCHEWNTDLLRKVLPYVPPCCRKITPHVTVSAGFGKPMFKVCRHTLGGWCCVTPD